MFETINCFLFVLKSTFYRENNVQSYCNDPVFTYQIKADIKMKEYLLCTLQLEEES